MALDEGWGGDRRETMQVMNLLQRGWSLSGEWRHSMSGQGYRRTVTVTGSGDQIISQSPLAYWESLADVSGGKKVSDCTVLSEGRPGLSNHRVGEGANPVVQPIHSRKFFIGLPGWYIPSSIPRSQRTTDGYIARLFAIEQYRAHREVTPEHSTVQCRR